MAVEEGQTEDGHSHRRGDEDISGRKRVRHPVFVQSTINPKDITSCVLHHEVVNLGGYGTGVLCETAIEVGDALFGGWPSGTIV